MTRLRLARLAVATCAALVVSACAPAAMSTTSAGAGSTASTAAQGATCSYPVAGTPARPVDPPSATGVPDTGTTAATLHFTSGAVTITLDRAAAPCTVNSFVSLASQGFFDHTACHRLVDTGIFILQCGDPTGTGSGGPGYSFADELSGHETYPTGTVAMANRGPNTNGSQFFLVWADSPLPPDYTVFGHMDAAGLAVIQGIASQGVSGQNGITPIADATITSVSLG